MRKILCLLIASLFLIGNVYGVDINDWSRGTGVDCVEGGETISTLDDQVTNYLQAPLEKALADHITGCTLTITSDSVITISAGSVVTTSSTGVMRMRRNTSTTTVDITGGEGEGYLDTDAGEEANTWYYIYIYADDDETVFQAIASKSAANPDATECAYYRLIGAALTDGDSDLLKAYYFGNGNTVTVMWDVPMNETTTVSNGGAGGGWTTATDCASSMPSISTLGIFGLSVDDSDATGMGIWIRPNGTTWSTNIANGITLKDTSGANGSIGGQRICMTNSSQKIDYYNHAGDGATRIDTEGFVYVR